MTRNRNEQTELADARSETKPIILLVEDNRDICEYIRSSFGEKYEVLVANDGKRGMGYCFEPDTQYHCV